MSIRRKNFSPSFKAKVAIDAIREDRSLNELSEEYEVHANVIRSWKKQFLENSESLFEDKRKRKSADKRNDPDRLYQQIGQLKVENDWLKKKLGLED